MANYHEIIPALDGESLTEALQQIENYASKNGFTELENWCKQELQGYEEPEFGVNLRRERSRIDSLDEIPPS